MCLPHASKIDSINNISLYQPSLLSEWKQQQIKKHRKAYMGWNLTQKMANEAIQASFPTTNITITNSPIQLGGEGGRAPGAGGGGGGAIGPGSRGGKGGKGGKIQSHSRPLDIERNDNTPAKSVPDPAPGSGGGGAGAIGPDSVGGDGGNGGDSSCGSFDVVPGDRIEVVVGSAGRSGTLPGQHGGPGEDTTMRIYGPDGEIKDELRARGGMAGKSGTLPDDWISISDTDIQNGFRISTLIAANHIDTRDGLLFISGGGWTIYYAPTIPFNTIWPIALTAKWTKLCSNHIRGLQISITNPRNIEVSRIAFPLRKEDTEINSFTWVFGIGAPLDCVGDWYIRVQSRERILSEISVNVRTRS
ncbi:hypothetical protein NVS89_09980 [Ancylobacter sp. MQZ15Z-1]|uniref:Uncharacterized protein n=1 Tax=Ancylobacter mangrovi TaxID=2972472 RepID=A0A9X2T3X7_9HYPH|nr:hypothetical protein [Ancylobacter mangrovi]MCS0495426.1 hypothetical protein [Ancylobacter mangrovi]